MLYTVHLWKTNLKKKNRTIDTILSKKIEKAYLILPLDD